MPTAAAQGVVITPVRIAYGSDDPRHWFSWMGTVLPFEIIHLRHLHLEYFLHRQPPLEDAQGDRGNFSGGKMDSQEIMHHPVHP